MDTSGEAGTGQPWRDTRPGRGVRTTRTTMSDTNPEAPFEDFEVEISDVSPEGSAGGRATIRLSSQTRLSRKARAWRIGMVASAFLLLLVVIVASVPGLRGQVVGLVTRFIPTPTATLTPSADRFYFTAAVPWAAVALDGQAIHLPRIGVDPPLQLGRGRHTLAWRADPFTPQQCVLDVPPTSASSCTIIERVRQGKSGPLASVVALSESLTTLPISQAQLLTQTIQAALTGFSDIVQPGETYLSDVPKAAPVTQPLRATLTMQVETGAATQQSCSLSLFFDLPCVIEGQNCITLCPVPWQDRQTAAAAPAAGDWLAFAVMHSSWDYATLDGQSIASNQPVDSGRAPVVAQPVLLRIGWDGAAWHVQPLFGPEQGAPIITGFTQIADDPACWPAEDFFAGQVFGVFQYRFVSGPNPAVGCLVAGLTSPTPAGATPSADAPVAYWLMRFGILLSVNAQAQRLFPNSPRANDYEQQLAQQLAALPGGLIFTPA